MIEKRNVGLAIVFTVLTCGLYGIYWFIKITDEVNYLSGEDFGSGLSSFLLTIITCGIYKFYWSYKMGKMVYKAQDRAGVYPTDNSVLYLVLSFFQIDIISYAIIQSDINNLV